jgi:hypothetical protein
MKQRTITSPLTARLIGAPPAPRVTLPAPPPTPAKGVKSPPAFFRPKDGDRTDVRPSTSRGDYEGGWQRVTVPNRDSIRVYSTAKRWRGIDVFIARPTFTSFGNASTFRIKIFAIIEGMDRVLVATGSYRYPLAVTGNQSPSTWVAGARVAADRFEVELSHNDLVLVPGEEVIDVGVVATDELVELPPMLGVIPASATAAPELDSDATVMAPGLTAGDPGWEIMSVHATRCAGAATRWLHLHDTDAILNAIGAAPVFSFGFPSIGNSINEANEALRSYRFATGLVVVVSTTGDVSAAAANGDVAWQVFFR